MSCKCPLCGAKRAKVPPFLFLEDRRCLVFPGGIITLSHTETVLIRMLLEAGHEGLPREEAIMQVYSECRGVDDPPTDRSFIITCSHLRRKLNASKAPIFLSRAKPHDQILKLRTR